MPDQELKQRIEEAVEKHRDEIVNALSTILKFNTVSGGQGDEAVALFNSETDKCLKYLESEAGRIGLDWRNYDNRLAVMEMPAGEKFVGLPLHIDVVPAGEGWTHGPFDGTVADETVWGRGCQDDKGPLIQMLWAVNVVKELGVELKRGAKLIIGTCEECGDWSDIKHYFNVEAAPEICIVSDAAFPIINGEKGMLNLVLKAEIPTDDSPTVGGYRFSSASAGERANIVPPRAELVFSGDAESDVTQLEREIARFTKAHTDAKVEILKTAPGSFNQTLVFHGKGAHGSTPEEGHNAALDLLLFMTESGFVSDDEADLAQFLYECGIDYHGGNLGVVADHDFMGPTTVNLGVMRWNNGSARIVYNVRPTMGLLIKDAVSRAQARVGEYAEETGFELNIDSEGRTMDAIFVDPEQHPEFIATLKDAYTAFTGREASLHAIGGSTYAKVFPNAVCFGPVDLAEEQELAHQTNERIKIDHLLRNVKIYSYALAKLCGA